MKRQHFNWFNSALIYFLLSIFCFEMFTSLTCWLKILISDKNLAVSIYIFPHILTWLTYWMKIKIEIYLAIFHWTDHIFNVRYFWRWIAIKQSLNSWYQWNRGKISEPKQNMICERGISYLNRKSQSNMYLMCRSIKAKRIEWTQNEN